MFTGIIQKVGRVQSVEPQPGGARIVIAPESPLDALEIGESIAVDGVCLTAEPGSSGSNLRFFLSPETLSRTTLLTFQPGRLVNLERSLAAGDKLGGHFVMGHVDAVGRINRLQPTGESWTLEVEAPPGIRPFLAVKGSVSVDGVSLTVATVANNSFTVAVIPHTYQVTTLRTKTAGATVNLEADVIARYVVNFLSGGEPGRGVSAELLRQAGFHR